MVAAITLLNKYYERRSKQYDNLGIRRERIVTLPAQIKCFVAMFLNEPHSTHRYYGELLSSYRQRLFNAAHSAYPYFASGLGLATVERLFIEGVLPRWLKQFKYQLLMVYRLQNESSELPHLNSRYIEKYCEGLIHSFDDQAAASEGFKRAGDFIDVALKNVGDLREPPEHTRVFTNSLSTLAKHSGTGVGTVSKLTGTVKLFSTVKWFGFIADDIGKDVYFRSSSILSESYGYLEKGQRVKFAIIDTPRGKEAVDVEVIDEA